MYGLVNRAIEDMILKHHGLEVWETIRTQGDIDVEVFISNEAYPDALTYQLVASSSKVLGVEAEEVLFQFGEYWVLHTAEEGYGALLDACGKTFSEFLENLPNFHTRIGMMFPGLQPPKFRVEREGDQKLRLHYYSKREGLAPFVKGLLSGLGKRFDVEVEVQHEVKRNSEDEHDQFIVTWS